MSLTLVVAAAKFWRSEDKRKSGSEKTNLTKLKIED